MKEWLLLPEINPTVMYLSSSSRSQQTPALMWRHRYRLPKAPTPAPQESRLRFTWAALSYQLVSSSHTTILTLGGGDHRQRWALGKPAFPSAADNREVHESAFSTNLMVSSQSLSSVLRKEKLKLAKSASLFSLPLIPYKSPGELNIAKSCHETAGW